MTPVTKKCVAQRGLEALGLQDVAPRKPGQSDLDYVKATLAANGLGYVERKGTNGELFVIPWEGKPTIEMLACRLATVEDIPAHALPGYGLDTFEFFEGTLESH